MHVSWLRDKFTLWKSLFFTLVSVLLIKKSVARLCDDLLLNRFWQTAVYFYPVLCWFLFVGWQHCTLDEHWCHAALMSYETGSWRGVFSQSEAAWCVWLPERCLTSTAGPNPYEASFPSSDFWVTVSVWTVILVGGCRSTDLCNCIEYWNTTESIK